MTGKQFRKRLRELGVTMERFAAFMGVHYTTIYRICRSAKAPTKYVRGLELIEKVVALPSA